MFCTHATSTEADTFAAATELSASLREALAGAPVDLLVMFVTPDHVDRLDELGGLLRRDLSPREFVGCTAAGLVAGSEETEGTPAVTVMALSAPGVKLDSYHVTFRSDAESGRLIGLPLDALANRDDISVVVLGDPFTFPVDALLHVSNEHGAGAPLIGGMASGGSTPGCNRLLCGDQIHTEGAVVLIISGTVGMRTIISQGCRPVGRHFIITKAKENIIQELGGRAAVECLREVLDGADEQDRALFRAALHIGCVIDEYKSSFGRGDFLVRSVVRIDSRDGSISINDFVRAGQTVQFHVRDPASASQDLTLLLHEQSEHHAQDGPPVGALLFSCNGRGSRMFGEPHHDAEMVNRHLPNIPVVGFLAAGEIGPVGGRNFLHGFTASIGVLYQREA